MGINIGSDVQPVRPCAIWSHGWWCSDGDIAGEKEDRKGGESRVSSEQAQMSVRVSGFFPPSLCSMNASVVIQQTGETARERTSRPGELLIKGRVRQ